MAQSNQISFFLNDRPIQVSGLSPTLTLLRYLRDHEGMRGTKEGCAEGDCGACTVALLEASSDPQGALSYKAMNSCLMLLPMVDGKRIYTVEGLKDKGEYHPIQEAMVSRLGSQCGYCTPGVVMSLFEACYRDDLDEPWQVDDQLCGNLCRCTGYRPIQEAAQAVAGLRPDDRFSARLKSTSIDAQEPSIPHELIAEGEGRVFMAPTSLDSLWTQWSAHPDALLIAGGTDLALMITKRFEHPRALISVAHLQELQGMSLEGDVWSVGAGEPLSSVEARARDLSPPLERMLRFFGARQIKNRGTLGGNLCTASPIGDTAPVLLALGASVVLRSAEGERTLPLDSFFTGYRLTALKPQELVTRVLIPIPQPHELCRSYKVSKRQELDISTVSSAFWISRDPATHLITDARLAYGGVAATPTRALQAERALIGQPWAMDTIERAVEALDDDFTPLDDHRGSAWYRTTVAQNLLRGFALEVDGGEAERLPYRPTATVYLSSPSQTPSPMAAHLSKVGG